MDDELNGMMRAWQAWDGVAPDLLRTAIAAHRRQAALSTACWAALALGAIAVVTAVYLHGVTSWPQVLFAAGALLFGAGTMLFEGKRAARDDQQLTATPRGVVENLTRMRARELEGWTATWVKVSVGALACGGAAIAITRLRDATQQGVSLLRPGAALAVYALALLIVLLVGRRRVRGLRAELAELTRLREELSE